MIVYAAVDALEHAEPPMPFSKSKALENALKFLNQGKVSQAVAEYQQILRHDPKDQATLMTVGDLFARQGDMPHAIEYFERLAQVYLSDGFNSKAIAIYKKIAKLAPAELPPLERLADLYVQQGVLSEARPLFLQLAEAYLTTKRAQKAVEVLHRLLEIEPDNPRVQLRLAELYLAMGQKKEASETYLAYAQRLLERGEQAEAQKLIHQAVDVDPSNQGGLLLLAKFLANANQAEKALRVLERHPEADGGGEVTHLLVDCALRLGRVEAAADRARNQLVRGSAHFVLLHRVVDTLIESGTPAEALPLLRELRDPMIEAAEHEKFMKSLSAVAERLPQHPEPLEMLADFCRHTSDPFRLNAALDQLAELYVAGGNFSRAESVLEEMIERNKEDERLVARLNEARARARGEPPSAPVAPLRPEAVAAEPPAPVEEPAHAPSPERAWVEPQADEPPRAPAAPRPGPIAEAPLDEETEAYIAQVLTDVDLFSSYGLAHKASHLLESVLARAPRHTPTLERLLDFSLGAGDDRRIFELAALLEQIHIKRDDAVNAERFAVLRQRFEKAAAQAEQEAAAAESARHQAAPAPPSPKAASPAAAPPPEHPPVAHPAPPAAGSPVIQEFEIPGAPPPEAAPTGTPAPRAPAPAAAQHHEVDLSDDWEAMVREAAEPAPTGGQAVTPHAEAAPSVPMQEAEPAAAHEIDLELTPQAPSKEKSDSIDTDELIDELIAEIAGLEASEPAKPAKPSKAQKPAEKVTAAGRHDSVPAQASAAPPAGSNGSSATPELTAENLNQLSEVFQEFRSELGELAAEEEEADLETHYNLGIAYREMGLLDEAIGEFQKVAKAVDNGKPFPYAMNCSSLLGLAFMEKGEPKIASLWYQRALDVPDLDQETILALRYDLGVSLESAGESTAALDSFRQVYAKNIDYRDVADHIATLQKR